MWSKREPLSHMQTLYDHLNALKDIGKLRNFDEEKEDGRYRSCLNFLVRFPAVLLDNRARKINVPGGKISKTNNRSGPDNRVGMTENLSF